MAFKPDPHPRKVNWIPHFWAHPCRVWALKRPHPQGFVTLTPNGEQPVVPKLDCHTVAPTHETGYCTQALGRWEQMPATLGWQTIQTDVPGSQQLLECGTPFWALQSPKQLGVGDVNGFAFGHRGSLRAEP